MVSVAGWIAIGILVTVMGPSGNSEAVSNGNGKGLSEIAPAAGPRKGQ